MNFFVKSTFLVVLAITLACAGSPPAATADPAPAPEPVPSGPPERPEDAAAWDPQYDDSTMGWWNDTVFYLNYIRSFRDSDADQVGDIQGVIEKLDYLNDGDPETTDDLGIGGIWFMPVQENNTSDPHGYHIIDYYKVEEDYGTNEDWQQLIQESRARGIKIVIDLVINHSGDDHPWFQAALQDPDGEFRDFYVWADEPLNAAGPWGQTVWHSSDGGQTYYYGVFNGLIPDLNYNNPAVTEEIKKIAQYWIEEMGVDGFRIDAAKYLVETDGVLEDTQETLDWFADFHQFYKGFDEDFFTVGEVWSSTETVAKYVGDKLDIAFEFDLAADIIQSVRRGSIRGVVNRYETVQELFPVNQWATFLTNHDQNRVMNSLGDWNKMKLAAAFLLTGPGVPFIYYGEELGLLGEGSDTDKRRPMQWDNTPDTLGFTDAARPYGRGFTEGGMERTVENQTDDPDSLLSFYRDLIHIRNDNPSLGRGEMIMIPADNSRVFAALRYTPEEQSLVIINLSGRDQDSYGLSLWNGPFEGEISLSPLYGAQMANPVELNESGGFDYYKPIDSLSAESVYIFEIQ